MKKVFVILGVLAFLGVVGIGLSSKETANTGETIKSIKEFTYNIKKDESIFKDTMVEMNFNQVKEAAAKNSIVLFPISVVEEHGPHMSLGTDIYMSNIVCRMMKNILEINKVNTVIAPPYYWGINVMTGKFEGSFSAEENSMKSILRDSVRNLNKWGFKNIYFVNLHGDPAQNKAITQIAWQIRDEDKIAVYNIDEHIFDGGKHKILGLPELDTTKYSPDFHAGADETKAMSIYYPKSLNEKTAKSLKPQDDFAPLGYVGDPANFKKGVDSRVIVAQINAYKILDRLKK